MTQTPYLDMAAERSVIGSILQDPQCWELLSTLTPEDFASPDYRACFLAARKLRAQSLDVDITTVAGALDKTGFPDAASLLITAVTQTPTSANARSYARIVMECSRRRQIKALFEGAVERLAEDGADTVIDTAMDGLRALMGSEGMSVSAGEVAMRTYDMLDAISRGERRAIPTPLPDLNNALSGGLRRGELTVLAAYTGQGKSAMAQEIARHAAQKGHRVLLVSREMGPEQYGIRSFSSITGLDIGDMMRAKGLTPDQWQALAGAVDELGRLPIGFCFRASTVEDVRIEARRLKGLDLLIVDYLQILRTSGKYPNDNARVAYISRMLKDIALDLQIPVLALSQFSRPLKGVQTRPRLSDLRDSGSIEQDADNVWLMWQPRDDSDADIPPNYAGWVEAAEAREHRFLLLDVAKQRMGRTGILGVCFNPQRMRFYSPKVIQAT